MNTGDKYIIKHKTFIEKGFAPPGSILEILNIDNKNIEVIISPIILENGERTSLTIKTLKGFIESCSSKLN